MRENLRLICVVIAFALVASTPGVASAGCKDSGTLGKTVAAVSNNFFGPAWVPMDQVLDKNGRFRADVMGSTGLAVLEAKAMRIDRLSDSERLQFPLDMDKRADESTDIVQIRCPIVSAFPSRQPEPRPHGSLAQIVANSEDVLIGTVIETANGFSFGTAGSLLRVQVERSLKNSAQYGETSEVFIFYPHASFIAGGKVFCNQGWFGPDSPKIGNRVFVTPFRESDGEDALLIHAEWWEFPAFVDEGSRVHRPDSLSTDQVFLNAVDPNLLVDALVTALASPGSKVN